MNLKQCAICGQVASDEIEMHEFRNTSNEEIFLCTECADTTGYTVCDGCGCIMLEEQEDEATFTQNGACYCINCRGYNVWTCSDCGCVIEWNDDNGLMISNGNRICNSCWETGNYITCPTCNEMFYYENGVYDDYTEEYYCSYECIPENEERTILEYHSGHPDGLTFFGNGPIYFGVEIEVDDGGFDHDNAQTLIDTLGEKHCHCESDGSLDNGFELITQPMTYEYYKENIHKKIEDLMRKATKMGYKAHDTQTCGLHVHVSRQPLKKETENKIWHIFFRFKNELLKFSRRKDMGKVNTYCKLPETAYPPDYTERYCAINLTKARTVEIRLWKGTLNADTFLATIQMSLALVEFCNNAKWETIKDITWNELSNILAVGNTELTEYLITKGLLDKTNKPFVLPIYEILKRKIA